MKDSVERISLEELTKTIRTYEDVICMFFYQPDWSNPLDNVIIRRVEEIVATTSKQTDSLVRLVKIEANEHNKRILEKRFNVTKINSPTVVYFQNGKIMGQHSKTFTAHILKGWVEKYFYNQ